MARPAPPRGAPQAAGEDRTVRILLVDDVLPFIELQKNYLKRTTCRILTARTGAQALKVCRLDRPDLIFLDEAMPGMDGIEACRHLKADPLVGGVPVVIVSGEGRREECRQAGCDGVLIKPFDAPAFLEMVRRFVPLLERNEGRIPVSCRVEFSAPSGSYTAYTRDVSLHGLFLKSPRPFAIGVRLHLTLHLPMRPASGGPRITTSLNLEGEVRRVVRAVPGERLLPGVGVRFLDMRPEALDCIERFIASRR
ncbi:MAG TPA: response regulator [Candidatus Polarisedimenticolia bacterium]|jgi:CheY-like chemotaxis protein|nr:response regulator [Candidatus Polarisedimenticolia bacterium]